jgi:hypothetical protein
MCRLKIMFTIVGCLRASPGGNHREVKLGFTVNSSPPVNSSDSVKR